MKPALSAVSIHFLHKMKMKKIKQFSVNPRKDYFKTHLSLFYPPPHFSLPLQAPLLPEVSSLLWALFVINTEPF